MDRKIIAAVLLLACGTAGASEKASGTYEATRACDAYSSFSKGNNPGALRTQPGASYEIIEVNAPGNYDWVRVEYVGAQPRERWVSKECGLVKLEQGPASHPGKNKPGGDICHLPNKQDSFVLAVTWQPGFCEHYKYNGVKPECDALARGELVIDHLTLHGLWPNLKQCGTNYAACHDKDKPAPKLDLSEETVSRIAPWMPNFYYSTTFGSYEWDKHGTCQSLPDDDYFNKAVSAVQLVDASEIGTTIRNNIGGKIDVDALFATLRTRYGAGVADNLMLICADQNYLQEIRLNLPLDFSVTAGLDKLVGGGGMGARTKGCSGEVRVEASGPN